MLVSFSGCLESVKLLNSGTDAIIHVVGQRGITALDMAADGGHENIVD